MEINPWYYQGEVLNEIPEGYIGFVYKITNLLYDKKYIGKKLFMFRKTKQKNKKRKKILVESDWKEYNGSNKELLEDIQIFGHQNFKKEILYLCRTKGHANYIEMREIFKVDALLDPLYYNAWASVRVTRAHLNTLKKEELS